MGHTLSVVEKAGNLSIEEEDVVRTQLSEMEDAEEKEQANDRAIEDKIQVCSHPTGCGVYSFNSVINIYFCLFS